MNVFKKNIGAVQLQKENDMCGEVGRELQDSLQSAKDLDKDIAHSLGYTSGLVNRIPVINKLKFFIRQKRPLSELESELRRSVNKSNSALAKIKKQIQDESERLTNLSEVYETAKNEGWSAPDFMDYIEANTDISYVVKTDGEQVDVKELFRNAYEMQSPEGKAEEDRQFFAWFESHIKTTSDYIEGLNMLGVVGTKWVGVMSRNYFDVANLKTSSDQMRLALEKFNDGGINSLTAQKAVREYGKIYVKGIGSLVEGYNKINKLKDQDSDNFKSEIDKLQGTLETRLQLNERN